MLQCFSGFHFCRRSWASDHAKEVEGKVRSNGNEGVPAKWWQLLPDNKVNSCYSIVPLMLQCLLILIFVWVHVLTLECAYCTIPAIWWLYIISILQLKLLLLLLLKESPTLLAWSFARHGQTIPTNNEEFLTADHSFHLSQERKKQLIPFHSTG